MQTWLMIFSIVAAIALVVQGAMLIALFFEIRQTNKKVNGLVTDLHALITPLPRDQRAKRRTEPPEAPAKPGEPTPPHAPPPPPPHPPSP